MRFYNVAVILEMLVAILIAVSVLWESKTAAVAAIVLSLINMGIMILDKERR